MKKRFVSQQLIKLTKVPDSKKSEYLVFRIIQEFHFSDLQEKLQTLDLEKGNLPTTIIITRDDLRIAETGGFLRRLSNKPHPFKIIAKKIQVNSHMKNEKAKWQLRVTIPQPLQFLIILLIIVPFQSSPSLEAKLDLLCRLLELFH